MLDIKRIRENPDEIRAALKARRSDIDLEPFFEMEQKRRALIAEVDAMRSKSNADSKQVPVKKKNGEDGLPLPPYAVYNIGGGRPVSLLDFVTILQEELVRAGVLPKDYDFEAHKKLVPMQPGDVPVTYADTEALERDFGYRPEIDLRTGLRSFAKWYRAFYTEK